MADAIGAAGAGLNRARALLETAAVRVARDDLPTAPSEPTRPEVPSIAPAGSANSPSLGDNMALALIARENHAANRAVLESAAEAYRSISGLA